jgi:hypothetical protein
MKSNVCTNGRSIKGQTGYSAERRPPFFDLPGSKGEKAIFSGTGSIPATEKEEPEFRSQGLALRTRTWVFFSEL